MAGSKSELVERLRRNSDKWTSTLMDAGWTVIPSVILEHQQALGLDHIDMNILAQLARYWWFADNPPHPSKKAIAGAIGVAESTVRKHVAKMEAKGLIQRQSRFDSTLGRQTNAYLFTGLIEKAQPFAIQEIARRTKRREDAERDARKRLRRVLTVVDGVE